MSVLALRALLRKHSLVIERTHRFVVHQHAFADRKGESGNLVSGFMWTWEIVEGRALDPETELDVL